jgi:hypothetical protein
MRVAWRGIAVLAASIAGFVSVPADAASTQQISGMFTVHFPKAGQMQNVFACPPGVLCAVGNLKGFGRAEIDVFDNNFQPIAGTNCFSFSVENDISLIGTASTLVLVGSGEVCFPGNTINVPPNGSNQDYGHPSFWTSNLTVDSTTSTGVFAGVTGDAIVNIHVSGGIGIWQLSGTIATP